MTAPAQSLDDRCNRRGQRVRLVRRRALGADGNRRGAISGMLVIGLILLFAILGLALELGLLQHVQIQLQTAVDSAALAGASELLDENVLRPGTDPDWSDDIEIAFAKSQQFAGSNIACGQAVAIAANPQNNPAGDFVVAWLDSSTDRSNAPQFYPDSQRCNTLIVRATRTADRGNPVPLWFSPLLGLASADVMAESRATLDQRVYGFRPQGLGVIPVVPLAALARGSEEAWLEQSQSSPVDGENDKYSVDYRTGAVTTGADGIPEIELKAPLGDAGGLEGNFLALDFNPEPHEPGRFKRQLESGLTAHDLVSLGGQLALDASGQQQVIGVGIKEKAVGKLREIVGENRVWPLFTSRTDDDGEITVVLGGFAAGRIVDARLNDDNEAVVLVQASTLVTATALVRDLGPNEQLNTWIARLCLTR